jgi:hypothetical protein
LKRTEIRELIVDKDWKSSAGFWEEIEKTGIGLENDRNSATMGYISAAFLNDTVYVFFYFTSLAKRCRMRTAPS